jgi:uncharacterized protein (DUF1684 family)
VNAHLIVVAASAAVAAALAAGCTSGPPPPVSNQSQSASVQQWRSDKDAMFKSSKDSPLLPEARASFTALSYWPIDPAYRVPAGLTQDRSGPPVIIQLDTSTGPKRRMQKVGTLGFTLKQSTYQLTAFADLGAGDVNRLFVPFGDLTNKQETYGGGRYIELDRTPTGLYDLDFNRAYHPFCVFNPNYECPVPPRENRLQVSIPAGERLSSPSK